MDAFYGHKMTRGGFPLVGVIVVVVWSGDVSVQIIGGLNLV